MTEGCRFVFKFHTFFFCYFSWHILRLWPCLCRCSTKKWIHGLGTRISGVIRFHMGGLLKSFLSQVRAYIKGMLYLPTTKAYEDTMVVYAIQSCDKKNKVIESSKTWLITVHHFLKWMLQTAPSQLYGLRDMGLDVSHIGKTWLLEFIFVCKNYCCKCDITKLNRNWHGQPEEREFDSNNRVWPL